MGLRGCLFCGFWAGHTSGHSYSAVQATHSHLPSSPLPLHWTSTHPPQPTNIVGGTKFCLVSIHAGGAIATPHNTSVHPLILPIHPKHLYTLTPLASPVLMVPSLVSLSIKYCNLLCFTLYWKYYTMDSNKYSNLFGYSISPFSRIAMDITSKRRTSTHQTMVIFLLIL